MIHDPKPDPFYLRLISLVVEVIRVKQLEKLGKSDTFILLRGRGRVQQQLGLGALIGGQRLAFAHPTRTHVFLTLPRSEALDSFVQLHAKGVQRHGHQGVLAHREHRVHELFGGVPLTQGRPGRIADEELRMQLVGRT